METDNNEPGLFRVILWLILLIGFITLILVECHS